MPPEEDEEAGRAEVGREIGLENIGLEEIGSGKLDRVKAGDLSRVVGKHGCRCIKQMIRLVTGTCIEKPGQ
jgi:hypothetical protein